MPSLDVVVSCPVFESFRVQQVAGLFDVPLAEKCTEKFAVDLPDVDEPWQVGLIVGPSGSGKSSVARHCFAEELYRQTEWPADKAVVDCFGQLPVRQVIELFTAVGFSSPPSWVKPYRVLSCGERFRCDLARALSGTDCEKQGGDSGAPIVVFDEYTSVVDRNVAKACSMALAKGIRRGSIPCRFVAVTCHYDVAEWLAADWVLDMATGQLDRRRLRRPTIDVQVHRCRMAAWKLFAKHHYLSSSLAIRSRCYLATWNGEPVTFCATLPLIAKKKHRRFTRIVTLPDYQGMGIGMRTAEAVASLQRQEGYRMNVTSSHPAVIRHCRYSKRWKAIHVKKTGASACSAAGYGRYRTSAGRAVVSFENTWERNVRRAKRRLRHLLIRRLKSHLTTYGYGRE